MKSSKKGEKQVIAITKFFQRKDILGSREDFISESIKKHTEKIKSEKSVAPTNPGPCCIANTELKTVNEKEKNVEACCNAKIELKKAKQLIKKLTEIHLKKDLEIEELKKKLKKTNFDSTQTSTEQLDTHKHLFNSDELRKIRSIKSGSEHDSNFVLNVVQLLYKGTEEKLTNRSVCSRKHKGIKKRINTRKKRNSKKNVRRKNAQRIKSKRKDVIDEPLFKISNIQYFKTINSQY